MKRALSRRDARALARGISIIGVIVLAGRGFPAWRHWEHATLRDAGTTLHSVALLEAGVQALPAMRDSLRARSARLDSLSQRLLSAETVQAATAILATHVSYLADELEVKVNALQLRSDSSFSADGFARTALRINATSDVAGLAGLMAALEGDSLTMNVREMTVSQPEPAAADSKVEALHFEILVEALAIRSTPKGTP